MKTIINIAKNELRQFFYSPIAWILIVIFFVQTGMAFSEAVTGLIRYSSLGFGLNAITNQIFQDSWSGIYPGIQTWLYLYIPLLTMGIISREISSGTDKLLLSSPVTETQVVVGKFLAMAVLGLVMFAVVIIEILLCLIVVPGLDYGPVFSGFLGLYLLLLAYSAIGIFMSSVTRYQILAAVGTILVLFGLNWLTTVGQGIPVIREIAYWCGIAGRADTFIQGMICSEDVIYFLSVIVLFLVLTVLKLKRESKTLTRKQAVSRYVSVLAAFCLVAFVSSIPYCKFYFDTTHTKSCTLTKESQEVMDELEGPLTITTYVNLLGNDFYTSLPQNYTRDVARFSWYTRFKPEIKMKYVYYWHNSESNPIKNKKFEGLDEEGKAKRLAEIYKLNFKRFLSSSEIEKFDSTAVPMIDLKSEDYRFVRVIERPDGKFAKLRLYDDQEKHPGEMEITAAMKRLTGKSVKVGILVGHGERGMYNLADKGYFTFASSYTFRHALVNQGFDVEEVNVVEEDIPDDISILLIADPQSHYTPTEQARIDRYIDKGGNLLIAAKPYNRGNLDGVMKKLGLGFIPGILVQESSIYSPDLIVADIAPQALNVSPGYATHIARKRKFTGVGTMGIDTSSVSEAGFKAYAVMTTDTLACDSTRVWNELQVVDFENDVPMFSEESGERLQDRAIVVEAQERTVGSRQQKVVVIGNADMISNGELLMSRSGINAANYGLITESFRYLSDGEYPVYAPRPRGIDNELKYLDRYSKKPLRWAFNFIIPLLMALVGIFVLIRRKGR